MTSKSGAKLGFIIILIIIAAISYIVYTSQGFSVVSGDCEPIYDQGDQTFSSLTSFQVATGLDDVRFAELVSTFDIKLQNGMVVSCQSVEVSP